MTEIHPAEIYLAGGCFWGVQEYFRNIPGILHTEVGYANGETKNPTYEEVCTGATGYAEAVRVAYNPAALPLSFLLELFFEAINPTTLNRQGADVGAQYRSGVYYASAADKPVIEKALAALQRRYDKPVVVECAPLRSFYPAEAYHQQYLQKNAGGYCHISPQRMRRAATARVDPARYPLPCAQTLKAELPPLAYAVTQQGATEPPYSHPYDANDAPGIYVDITTGEPLFSSRDKFHSGCGWPAFSRPIDPFVMYEREDLSAGMARTEVKSRAGGAHLGHVFDDGPREQGGLRYCINGAALRFVPREDMEKEGYGDLMGLV